MTWSRRRVLLLVAALCLLAGLALWHTWVPSLADGSSCPARVYSFGPGGGVPYGSGESPPAAVDAVNALCRHAARASWWWGTALLVAGAVLALTGLARSRRPALAEGR